MKRPRIDSAHWALALGLLILALAVWSMFRLTAI